MLIHHLSRGTPEHRMAGHISQSTTPNEYRSERMSTPTPANCSGLANSGVPAKAPGIEIAASAGCVGCGLGQPKVDDFRGHSASLLELTMMLLGLMSR